MLAQRTMLRIVVPFKKCCPQINALRPTPVWFWPTRSRVMARSVRCAISGSARAERWSGDLFVRKIGLA